MHIRQSAGLVSIAAALLLSACSGGTSSAASSPTPTASSSETTITSGQLAGQLTAASAAKGSVQVLLERAKQSRTGRLRIEGDVCLTDPNSSNLTYELDDLRGDVVSLGSVWYISGLTKKSGKPWFRPPNEPPAMPAHLPQDLLGEVAGLIQPADIAGLTTYGTEVPFVQQAASAIPGTSQWVAQLSADVWLSAAPSARQDELGDWLAVNEVSDFRWIVNVDSDGLPVQQVFSTLPNLSSLVVQVRYVEWACHARPRHPHHPKSPRTLRT